MPLTVEQRSDLQGDLGIGPDQSIFTDYEMDRAFTRADSDLGLAKIILLQQLVASPKRLMLYLGSDCPEDQQKSMKQQLIARLTRLEEQAGLTLQSLSMGGIDLNLDYGKDDFLSTPDEYAPLW